MEDEKRNRKQDFDVGDEGQGDRGGCGCGGLKMRKSFRH